MAGQKAAWGIEIGGYAIKALRLERDGKAVRVTDFAYIPHKKVLTTPDLDQDEMIRLSLGQFISQKSLEGEHLVMSVPGHSAFARFAKLPPVDPKKVPDIVKFEAVQQIPFPIDEVEWDYQTFVSEDTPEIEVGIFAITRKQVQDRLGLYSELGLSPETMTLSPVAVYNAMEYDETAKASGPIIFLDIGTNATDVVIAEEGRCWIRTFPLGGTHFTEAIANAFKLSYSKAEKLKHEAATSKYAKQIMQAMRPVFSDLLQDLQRSIGYYSSLHRDKELNTMVGIGSTFKIPGLRKFIGQQLQINVVRLDEYKKIAVTGREAASFAEHAVNMATAYGLALQGVGLAPIDVNLVPVKVLREQSWHSKTKWFAAAAAIIIVGAAMTLYRPITERGKLNPGGEPAVVAQAISLGNRYKTQLQSVQDTVGHKAINMTRLLDYRNVWPYLINDAAMALASTEPQPELLSGDLEKIRSSPPAERTLVELQDLRGVYQLGANNSRRIAVTMDVELSHRDPIEFLNNTVAAWLRENAEPTGARADAPYRILPETLSLNPAMLTTLKAASDGTATVLASGGGGDGRRDDGDQSGGGTRVDITGQGVPRQAPGRIGSSGGNIAGPGAMVGEDRKPPVRRHAPGRIPTTGGSRPNAVAPSSAGPTPSSGTPFGSGSQPGASESTATSHIELDALAPIPAAPSTLPADATYYSVPITFQIEIFDPHAPPAPAPKQAGAPSMDKQEASS